MSIITYIIFGVVGLLVLLLLVAFLDSKFGSASSKEAKRLKSLMPHTRIKKASSSRWIKVYNFYDKIPIIGNILDSYRTRLTAIYISEERSVRIKAAKDLSSTIGIVFLFIAVALYYKIGLDGAVSTFFVMIVSGVYTASVLFDFFIARLDKKVLYEHEEALGAVKDAYNASKMVRLSLEEGATNSPSLAAAHLRQVSSVLGEDSDRSLQDYYDVAPNDFMRKLASVGRNIMKFGETGEDDHNNSMFIDGTTKIIEELHMEITKREKLDYMTAGFKFMAISPVFFIDPLKAWSISNMSTIAPFYESTMGLYVTVIIYVSILISFIGSTMVKNLSSGNRSSKNEGRTIKKVLKKSLFLRKMIDRVAPMHKETLQSVKVMKRAEPLLKKANSSLNVRELYARKYFYALMTFVLVIAVQYTSHTIQVRTWLDLNASSASESTSSEYQAKQKRLAESEILQRYKDTEITDEQFLRVVGEDNMFNRYAVLDDDAENYIANLLGRLRDIQNETFMWYDILISLGVAYLAYWIPNVMLLVKANLRKWDMQTEVDGFYTDILILSKNERVMVYEIIETMHRYSSIFEPQLLKCMMSYNRDPIKALDRLAEDCNFAPLARIAERLKSSVNKITLREAFRDLESQRAFSLEQRELQNEKTISNRATLAKAFGSAPIVILLVGYLGLPWGFMAFDLFMDTQSVSGNLL